MEREDFNLTKFKLSNKSDIEVSYKNNGIITSHEFSAPIHNDLYEAFLKFDEVFKKLTGINPNNKSVKIESCEVRTVHVFHTGDEKTFMLTEIIVWKNGYSNSMNTPREPLSIIRETTGIDIEALLHQFEDEVYALLEQNKLGHEQSSLL